MVMEVLRSWPYIQKIYVEEQNLKNRRANSQEVLRTKTIKQMY